MKIVALLAALLILSALAVALLGVGGQQWGQVAVSFSGQQLSVGLPSFVIFLLVLILAILLLEALWKLPKRWADRWQQLSARKKERVFLDGLALFAQGEWLRAHDRFVKAAESSPQAKPSQLLSMLALLNARSFAETRRALSALSSSGIPGIEHIIAIKRAEVELRSGNNAQAFERLQRLFARHAQNQHISALLSQAFVKQDQPMPSALGGQLLSLAAKGDAVAVPSMAERRLLGECLHEASRRKDKKALDQIWKKMRKPMQNELAGVYAECLGELGLHEKAEHFMRQSIEAGWGDSCLDYCARMDGGHIDQRIASLEKRLQVEPRNAALLLCLSRLHHRRGGLEKARQCLKLHLDLMARKGANHKLHKPLNEQDVA